MKKFLKNKEKVKITLRFRGREITHHQLGLAIVNNVINAVADISQVDSLPIINGICKNSIRGLMLVLIFGELF